MKTSLRLHILLLLTLITAFGASAQADWNQPLPPDTALRHGVLPNGFSYYVMRQPGIGTYNLKLVTRVGSVCETPAESGLAHFLEHMTFEGTRNFPADSATRLLRSFGLEAGTDFNATTGFDETEFDIKNVTVGIEGEPLRNCMLILRDWASGLTLADSAINRERSIIEEEWRTGHNYTERLLDTMLTTLLHDSPYQGHLPIGRVSNIRSSHPQVLRQFYHKWYRPNLQAIFVVGEVDPDATVTMIKRIFGPLTNPADAPERKPSIVPDHKGADVLVYADDEATSTTAMVFFLHEKPSAAYRSTRAYYHDMMVHYLATTLLNMRFNDLVRTRHTGLLQGGSDYDDFLVSHNKEAFCLLADAEPRSIMQALQALITEGRRAQLHGFTPAEFQQGMQFWQAQLQSYKQSIGEMKRADIIESYVDNFEDGDDLYSPAESLDLMIEMLHGLTLSQVNAFMAQVMSPDNVSISIAGPHIPGYAYPTEGQIRQQFAQLMQSTPEPFTAAATVKPLMTKLPKPGKVVKSTASDDITLLRLSNGAKVLLRPTDCKTDEILFSAFSNGGYSACGSEHNIAARAMDDVIEASGLGGMTYLETEKAILNKNVSLSFSISNNQDKFTGQCGKQDFTTLMQLVYLYFTSVTKDTASFHNLTATLRSSLMQANNDPDAIFSDSTVSTLRGNYVFTKPFTAAQVDSINYDEVLALYRQRVSNPADFVFTLVGSFQVDSVVSLIERYIASIPRGTAVDGPGTPLPLRQGSFTNSFTVPMSTVKSRVDCVQAGYMPLNTQNMANMELLEQALDELLNARMRQATGGTYGVDVSCGVTEVGEQWTIRYQFDTNNDMRQQLVTIADSTIAQVLHDGISAELFDKIHNTQLNNYYFAISDNKYWDFDLYMLGQYGLDYDSDYHDFILMSNLADFNKFVTSLKPTSHLHTIMQGVSKNAAKMR